MRRLSVFAIVVVLTIIAGQFVNSSGDSAIVGQSPDSGDQLSDLGPVDLIMAAYNSTVSVPCNRGTNSTNTPAVVGPCGQTFNPDVAGFNSTGSTTIVCTAVNGWSFDSVSQCNTNGAGNVQFSVDLTNPAGSVPCDDGTVWAQVVLTNPNMDTLTINITADNNENSNCTTV